MRSKPGGRPVTGIGCRYVTLKKPLPAGTNRVMSAGTVNELSAPDTRHERLMCSGPPADCAEMYTKPSVAPPLNVNASGSPAAIVATVAAYRSDLRLPRT